MYSSRLSIATFLLAVLAGGATLCHGDGGAQTLPVSVRELSSCGDGVPRVKSSEVREVARDGESLVVTVLSNAYCGGVTPGVPEARIAAGSITLSWEWLNPENGPVTACICTHRLQFRVKNVPPGEVVVTAEVRSK
jgi:hypothetical protein